MYNKPTEIEKYEWFKDILIKNSISLDVHEDKNVSHQITLLVEALDRRVFNLKTNCSIPTKEKYSVSKLQRFWIAKFNECFKRLTKVDCMQKPNGTTFRQMEFAMEKLKDKNYEVDEYLNWVFNVFLQDKKNATFLPPQLALTCSNFLLERFFVDNQELFEKKKEEALRNQEITDITNRYRVIIRNNPDNKELLGKLTEAFGHFKTGSLELKEFKEVIINLEENNK